MYKSMFALLVALSVMACEPEGPAERAGARLDDAVDQIGDATEDAADEAEDLAERVADEIDDAQQ